MSVPISFNPYRGLDNWLDELTQRTLRALLVATRGCPFAVGDLLAALRSEGRRLVVGNGLSAFVADKDGLKALDAAVRDRLPGFGLTTGRGSSESVRLGQLLAALEDKPLGGIVLMRRGTRDRAVLWSVSELPEDNHQRLAHMEEE